jgi:Polysaccharide lyase
MGFPPPRRMHSDLRLSVAQCAKVYLARQRQRVVTRWMRITLCLTAVGLTFAALSCSPETPGAPPGAMTSGMSSTGGTSGSVASSSGTSGGASSGGATSSGSASSTSGSGSTSGSSGKEGGVSGNFVATKMCSGKDADTDTVGPRDAPAALPAGVSFLTDWVARPVAGGFRYTQIQNACRYRPDGNVTWHNKAAVRVELNPGDDPLGLGTDRAELLIAQDAAGKALNDDKNAGDLYYATSYYFPPTWGATFTAGDGDSWSFLLQFYPFGGLAVGKGYYPEVGGPSQSMWFATKKNYKFADSSVPLGKWLDLVFHVNWSTGAFAISRRTEGTSAFATMVSGTDLDATQVAAGEGYLKQGIYRGPNVNGRTDVVWIGPTARGSSFQAVELAAFGTRNGP